MNALSPFSLFDTLSPGKTLGRIATGIATRANTSAGLAGAFSQAWTGLDANKDGTLNGKDVLSHAVGARNAVLQGIADTTGYDTSQAARALRAEADGATAQAAQALRHVASAAAPAAQMLIASAPPALPSSPAARAVENLPGIERIRATYTAVRTLH